MLERVLGSWEESDEGRGACWRAGAKRLEPELVLLERDATGPEPAKLDRDGRAGEGGADGHGVDLCSVHAVCH